VEAIGLGLIGINDLKSDEGHLAVDIANRTKTPIPKRFLKEMGIDMLFSNLPKKEVINEIIERIGKKDFGLPGRSRWDKYNIPHVLQKKLIPCLTKYDRKTLKQWKQDLCQEIIKEIVSIRIKEGMKKATKKEDPLLVAIKENSSCRLNYFKLDELSRERFLSVINYWLKAEDAVRKEIFKTPYVSMLDKNQYFEVLKSWLNCNSYRSEIGKLKLDVFHSLPQEYQYKTLEKFAKDNIKDIVPLPSLDEVKQIILPELMSKNREDAEKLYLEYKVKFLMQQMRMHMNGVHITDCLTEKEQKQVKVIKKGLKDSYYPSLQEVKFKVEVFEWILGLNEKKMSALCSFFSRR